MGRVLMSRKTSYVNRVRQAGYAEDLRQHFWGGAEDSRTKISGGAGKRHPMDVKADLAVRIITGYHGFRR